MHRIFIFLTKSIIVCTAICFCSSLLHAQSANFLKDCQQWIEKKGYSSDYIEQKVGKRQRGLPGSWRGNVAVREVQTGDVALIALPAGAQHAAFVEEVRHNADGAVNSIRLSEWNWGPTTNARCLVTENFGKLAPERWIETGSIASIWRPSVPLGN